MHAVEVEVVVVDKVKTINNKVVVILKTGAVHNIRDNIYGENVLIIEGVMSIDVQMVEDVVAVVVVIREEEINSLIMYNVYHLHRQCQICFHCWCLMYRWVQEKHIIMHNMVIVNCRQ